MDPEETDELDIAIVGMAARFPGAGDCDVFWENLREGRESVSCFSPEDLMRAGVAEETIKDPSFVPARGVLADAEAFDSAFFGFSPLEADVMDPQQRIALECAWHALEDAGYDPRRCEGSVGVFLGLGLNTYLLNNLQSNARHSGSLDEFQIMILNEKDTLPTRIAYKLDLRGPAVAVQTSCSTGLVAVHLACNSLLTFESDMALAGAVAVKFPQVDGYHYHPEGILSPDGHCRAFDADASGTVGGSGAGVLVLKRLVDAVAARDTIRAIVRGSAINNDGARKVSYMAPSVAGQAEVIMAAHARARVSPASIGFVEAHGTATRVGDPIEVAALMRAFRAGTDRVGYCALGSVKSNIGHLDAAAGLAGLIKAILSIEHGEIPATLHFDRPNPALNLHDSPFVVARTLSRWPDLDGPRRAGVSSFGVGGTNAHVVIQQSPFSPPSEPAARPWQLITWSATSRAAATALGGRLLAALRDRADDRERMADASYTLHVGRTGLAYREALVVGGPGDLGSSGDATPHRLFVSNRAATGARPVIFLFPGQGSQRPGMGAALYAVEPTYRRLVDEGAQRLAPLLECDVRDLLVATPNQADPALNRTRLSQPALFLHAYAAASVWLEWGICPAAVLGHSIGQYAAACVAGVMSFSDALTVVAKRALLIDGQPAGAMMACACETERLAALLPAGAWLAAANGRRQVVASGRTEAITALGRALDTAGIAHVALSTTHAFHSELLRPVVAPFRDLMQEITLHEPAIPVMSDITGDWLAPDQARSPEYWADHITANLNFSAAMHGVATAYEQALWLEVGSGTSLSTLGRNEISGDHVFVASEPAHGPAQDGRGMLEALARLWVEGATVDWRGFHCHEVRRRVRLPVYPFERRRHFIEARGQPTASVPARPGYKNEIPVTEWFYRPAWRSAALRAGTAGLRHVLLLADEGGLARRVAGFLSRGGTRTTIVSRAVSAATAADPEFAVAAGDHAGLAKVVDKLADTTPVDAIVYAWPLDAPAGSPDRDAIHAVQELAFFPLIALFRALARGQRPTKVLVVTEGGHAVPSAARPRCELAPIQALAKIIDQEGDAVRCIAVDISRMGMTDEQIAERLAAELAGGTDAVVALRGNQRWVQDWEGLPAPELRDSPTRLRDGGTFLVLGGLGRFGLLAAEILAGAGGTVILADRLVGQDGSRAALQQITHLRALGANIETRWVELADRRSVADLVNGIVTEFARLDGIVHAAGCPEQLTAAGDTTPEILRQHFAARVEGTLALADALDGRAADFVLLVSSLAPVLGGPGHAAYAASTAFLDAFAQSRTNSSQGWLSVGLESFELDPAAWRPSGALRAGSRWEHAIDSERLKEVLRRTLSLDRDTSYCAVSNGDLKARIARWIDPSRAARLTLRLHARRDLSTPFVAPRTPVEEEIAAIWSEMLGIEQIGIRDSFFELGGDSLLATRVVVRIRDAFAVELPMRRLFEQPTIEGVRCALEEAERNSDALPRIENLLDEIEGAANR